MVRLTKPLTLIEQAHAAGLTFFLPGDGRLVIDGPEEAETLALRLLERKAEVIATLALLEHLDVVASDFDDIPPGWRTFHGIPCALSSDGWAEFSRLRATPHGPLLCIHCGEVHLTKESAEASPAT
jgi:hypothetical protein